MRGSTFNESLDGERLRTLLARVCEFMTDKKWHTLREIADKCGGSEASVSARLRDLRRPENGGWKVERIRDAKVAGLFRYRVEAVV